MLGFDKAIKHYSGVANWHIAQGLKTALHFNPYYDSVDGGEINEKHLKMGPVDLIKFLKKKRAFRDEAIANFAYAKKNLILLGSQLLVCTLLKKIYHHQMQ